MVEALQVAQADGMNATDSRRMSVASRENVSRHSLFSTNPSHFVDISGPSRNLRVSIPAFFNQRSSFAPAAPLGYNSDTASSESEGDNKACFPEPAGGPKISRRATIDSVIPGPVTSRSANLDLLAAFLRPAKLHD